MNAERKLNELTKELEALKVRLALLEKMALERTEKPPAASARAEGCLGSSHGGSCSGAPSGGTPECG